MEVRILEPWICGGRLPSRGDVVELLDELARNGIDRGLCEPTSGKRRKGRGTGAGRARAEQRRK